MNKKIVIVSDLDDFPNYHATRRTQHRSGGRTQKRSLFTIATAVCDKWSAYANALNTVQSAFMYDRDRKK